VWKADHVWSVMARSFSYPSLHPNVLAMRVQAVRLSAADSSRRKTSWNRALFQIRLTDDNDNPSSQERAESISEGLMT
jgi:hypothetical protein